MKQERCSAGTVIRKATSRMSVDLKRKIRAMAVRTVC